eukprot:jgi/Psemu1/15930/gm1.15930_g
METPASGRQRQSMWIQASTMESDADNTPIPMLQILGRNASSGTISSLTTTRSRISYQVTVIPPLHNPRADDNEADNGKADDDEADGKDDANATSTMMLSHNATQSQISQINQKNHWDEELDRDVGDSDEKGLLAAAFSAQIQGCNSGEDVNKNNNKNDKLLHVGMQDGYYYKDGTQVEEATTYPKPPQDYSPPDNNKSKIGDPSWHDVDNPGAWNQSCYQSKFEKGSGGRYMYDKFPSGCTPVPGVGPVREYKGWMFHYQNWVPEEDTPSFSCRYTSSRDIFPQERKGKLDMAKLKTHGLHLKEGLTVMLYSSTSSSSPSMQMKRMRNKKTRWGKSPSILKSNTGKGHYVRRIKLSEIVHFDGIVYLHGALEGKKDSICYRWTKFDVLQIRSNLKLNCTHEAKYNRLLCKDDMSKFNYKKVCSDLCMDELSWAYYGFGGPMVDYLKGEMFSKGRQMDIFTKYVIPEIGKLWSSPPHLTADNFFNSDLILDWMGGLGFRIIGTVSQNRLSKTVEDEYFHKENVSSASGKRCSRVVGLCNPVTMLAALQRGTGVSIAHSRAHELAILVLSTVLIPMVSSCTRKSLDQIDNAILRSNIGYKSWKYYHAPINHTKALTVLTTFDMYQELTDEGLSSGRATQRSYPVFIKAKAGAE